MGGVALARSDGTLLPGPGRKALALLVYLSLAPAQRAPREKLADLLWPERTSDLSRNCLRQTVSVIRAACNGFGRDIFGGGRDLLALQPGILNCDASRLLAAASDQREPQPAGFDPYPGPFLDGFFSGSPVFDDWAAAMRERLETAAVTALHQRARTCAVEEGLVLLGRLLAIDPMREASYQLGMELYSAARQRDRALRCYDACRQMLAREYGVTPGLETERIRRRILESAHEPPVEPSKAKTPNFRRPAIRIHGFTNLSESSGLGLFLQGLTEAIGIELSRVPEFDVIEADATVPDGTPEPDFVLHGSLLQGAETLQVIVRLIHCPTGRQIAGERFRGSVGRQVDLLDDIALSVALLTRFEVLHHRWGIRDLTPVDPFPVRLLIMRSHARYYELTQASLGESLRLAEKALALSPTSLRAQRMMSLALTAGMVQGAATRDPENVSRAIDLARNVARAVPEDVFSRCVLAWALGNDGQHGAAVEELQYAIRLNPSYATLHSDLADHYALLGYVNEALSEVEEAIRLSNEDVVSFWRYHTLAVAHFAAGNYPMALENARRVMRDKPGILRGALFQAASAAALGLQDEARHAIAYILRQRPDLTLKSVAPGFMPRYVQEEHHVRLIQMLRMAGLPEG